MEDEHERGFPSVWGRSSDLEEGVDSALEYDTFEQGRHDTSMLGDMDHDSASLLPDTEGNEFDGDPPRQPNSKDAADTLTQFASHFALRHQGETQVGGGNSGGKCGGAGGYAEAHVSGGRRGQQRHQQEHTNTSNPPYGHAPVVGSAIAAKTLSPRKRRKLGMEGEQAGGVGGGAPAPLLPTPSPRQPVAVRQQVVASAGGCDAHFIVHLFVTAIADGKMQQDVMVPKTWDVLQQVITKVSKEQNTSVTLHGCTLDIKMRVFVCNSVEARAVGEYVTAHKDQRPAPFVVLARQLSMAIAYNSAHLDPSQAAVADRLRKQAKTRAVKEIREAMRDAPADINGPVLRGYVGALAPAAHIEALLLRRTVKVDLEGDEERAYIFFDAKNRSTQREGGVPVDARLPSVSPHIMKPTPAPSARSRKSPPVAHLPRQPHQSPVNARVQALQAPGSPLSPGGRDGAAALLSLFNSVSQPDAAHGAGGVGGQQMARHRPPGWAAGDYFGQAPGKDPTPGTQGPPSESEKVPERPLSGRSHPKHSLAAQAAANANAMAPHGAAAPSFAASRASTSGSPFRRVPRPQVAIPDADGCGGDSSGGLHGNAGGYDLNLVIASPKLRPMGRSLSQMSLGTLSTDLPPGCLLDAGARTPRSVVTLESGVGWLGGVETREHALYAAVNAGNITEVKQLLETPEGIRMLDEPIATQTPTGDAQSRSLQRHHLIPDSLVEYEVEDGVWWPAVVVCSIPGADHVTVRYHRPGAQAPIGEAPLLRETKIDKTSSKLRVPSDSPKDFTALMCACMLDGEEEASAMASLLLNHQADPNGTDSEGFTAMHWAAVKGHPSVLTLLLGKKALIDAPSLLSGETALLLAARYGRKDAVDVLLAHGAQSNTRTRQRMGLIELITSGRGEGCTDVLRLVLLRQPALRTLLLHGSAAAVVQWSSSYTERGTGGMEKEIATLTLFAETLKQNYTTEALTYLIVESPEDVGDGMSAIVRHAVQQVVMGKNRNCCCCLPYTYTAGRRVSHARNGTMDNEGVGSKSGARVDGEVHVELVAALYANEIDENIHRVAILDLDGSGGDILEEQVRKIVQVRQASSAARSPNIFCFSPDTSGNDAEARNLVLNIFRPSVGSKATSTPNEAVPRRSNDTACTNGAEGGAASKLSAAGTRDLLRQAIVTKLVPCLRAYAPDVIIMSARYPAAQTQDDCLEPGEPVPLTASDYEWATREIVKVAGICCKGRLVSLCLVSAGGGEAKGGGEEPGEQQLHAGVAHLRALAGC